jgi:hypothetical protein
MPAHTSLAQMSSAMIRGFRSIRLVIDRGARKIRTIVPTATRKSDQTPVMMLMVGREFAFVGVPLEIFVDFQVDVRARVTELPVFFGGYTNGNLGYVSAIKAAVDGGYGASQIGASIEVGARQSHDRCCSRPPWILDRQTEGRTGSGELGLRMNSGTRRSFLKQAGMAALVQAAFGQPAFRRMNVGVGRVDVTPDRPRYCACGDTPNPRRAYAPLISRVMTLFDGQRRMAIVNYPFNALDVATPILRERCERELGIAPEYLVLLATHNHQSPIQIIPDNFDYGRELVEKIFNTIRSAMKSEEGPADLLFGNGYGYFTRSQLGHPPDYEIQLLKVVVGRKTRAILFNHPTHPQLGPRNMYGPSHPGFAMDEIQARTAGATPIYADACGGNQYTYAPEGSDPLAACKARGHELAEVALKIMNGPLEEVTGAIEGHLTTVDLPLDKPVPYKRALELAEGIPLDAGLRGFPDQLRDTNWIRALVKHYKEGIPFPTRISEYVCTDQEFLVKEADNSLRYPCRFTGVQISCYQFQSVLNPEDITSTKLKNREPGWVS